jgi:hypothetical protein
MLKRPGIQKGGCCWQVVVSSGLTVYSHLNWQPKKLNLNEKLLQQLIYRRRSSEVILVYELSHFL